MHRIETATQQNDETIQAMFENNQRKADEFQKYETRLNQISDVSNNTATKVDTLGIAFKKFFQEMTSYRNTNPENMNAIEQLLDGDDESSMEIDDETLSIDRSFFNTQSLPGTNNKSALEGEGSQK